jgi:hypothetical protein
VIIMGMPRSGTTLVEQIVSMHPEVGATLCRRDSVAGLGPQLSGRRCRGRTRVPEEGLVFSEAEAAGLPVKIYGEYVENDTFLQPNGSTSEPTWSQFYADALKFEARKEKTLYYQNTVQAESSFPAVYKHLIKNFPQFDLGIPDQFAAALRFEA